MLYEFLEIGNLQFEIEKEQQYWYIVDNYDTPISLEAINIDPTKGFKTKEKLKEHLIYKLKILAKKLLKEVTNA